MEESPPLPATLPPPPPSKLPLILIGIFLILASGTTGFFLGQYLSSPKTPPAPSPTSIPQVTPSLFPTSTPNSTSNWKPYTIDLSKEIDQSFFEKYPQAPKISISFKYPPDWKLTTNPDSPSTSQFPIRKQLLSPDIKDYISGCDPENEMCKAAFPNRAEIKFIVAYNPNETDLSSLTDPQICDTFGECGAAAKKLDQIVDGKKMRLEYLREDSEHPYTAYIVISNNMLLKIRSYLPTGKNCVGKCPARTDPPGVSVTAAEINQILSTFKFSN